MADIIYFAGQCEAYNDTEKENIEEVNYALYHGGLYDVKTLGMIDLVCGTADNNKIVTRTRREYDLITNGLLRLMKDITDTNTILNGGSSEVSAALDNYYAELKDLLDRITSIEKEE